VSGYAGFLPFFLLFYEIKFFDMNVMKTAKQHTHTHKASFFFYGIEILFLKIKKEKKRNVHTTGDHFLGFVCCVSRIAFLWFVFFFFFFNFILFHFFKDKQIIWAKQKNLRA
jgi:hypothetical protein